MSCPDRVSRVPGVGRQEFWRDDALYGAWLMDARYRDHHFERHLHDETVIVVTEAGSGEVRTRLGTERSAPDTVWVFAAGEYHGGCTSDSGAWDYRALYLDAAALDALAGDYGEPVPGRLFVRPGLYRDGQLADALLRAHRSRSACAPLMERQTLWSGATSMLFGRYGEPRVADPVAPGAKTKMRAVRDHLASNFCCDISVDELSRLVGLSRFHLMRAFRRAYGLPPHAYVNQLRLIEAKRMLRAGCSPAEVAIAVGFYDQSHLNRGFRRAFSLTPAAFAALS